MTDFFFSPSLRILLMNLCLLLFTALGCFIVGYLVRDVEMGPTKLTQFTPRKRLLLSLLVATLVLELILMIASTAPHYKL